MECRAFTLTRCLTLLSPPLACAQGVPHQLYSGKRPGLKPHLSASVLPVCTGTKQPLPPELLISLPCPNSSPSGPATASGSQLGVTGSLHYWQEVGAGGLGWTEEPIYQGWGIS